MWDIKRGYDRTIETWKINNDKNSEKKMKQSLTQEKIKKCIKRKHRHNLLPDLRIEKLYWGREESQVITYQHGKSENNA